mmetsp:Transcript_22948/g.28153  ORF Transcript_22948/g.28153 Transcript_22948/m.28153 type:complete len:232 (+) Transcript_22948:153-848(+)
MFRLRKSQSLGLRLLLSESVFWFLLLLLLTVTVCRSQDVSFYDIEMNDIYGNKLELLQFKGKPVLVANLASECGYTEKGYRELNDLYENLHEQGLEILGVPSNQFNQENGDSKQISKFAVEQKRAKWIVSEKVLLNGADTHPLYKFLKGEYTDDVINCHDDHKDCDFWAGDGECQKNPEYMLKSCRLACKECVCAYPFAGPIKWNFEYFLIGRNGKVNERWPTGEYMIIMI